MNKNKELITLDLFLGKKLKDFRRRVGWSQSTLGDKVGISHQQIHKYEQGYSKISTHMLYKFSQIFETTMNSFFEGFTPTSSELKTSKVVSLRKEIINIFLIEYNTVDEHYIRKSLENMDQKINVYTLRSLDEVSNYLRRRVVASPFPRPDIILLDIMIQKDNGLSILKSLKQDRKTKDIPVIILTNRLDSADIATAYKNHASGYINKAFDFDVFQENLKIAIDYWTKVVILPDESTKAA